MATTSSIEETLSEYYKWGSANLTWESVECNKAFSAFGIYLYKSHAAEDTAFADSASSSYQHRLQAVISFAERLARALVNEQYEAITGKETYWDNIGFTLNFIEHLYINDNNKADVAAVIPDNIQTHDEAAGFVSKKLNDLINLVDAPFRCFASTRRWLETVDVSEAEQSAVAKETSEGFTLSEEGHRELAKLLKENLPLQEVLAHTYKIKRVIEEVLTAVEVHQNQYKDIQSEVLDVDDVLLRACQGVMADLGIYDGGISLDDFKKIIKQPSGYEPFIPYVVGEYEYEKALVRLLVKAGSAGSQPAIYDAVINVDIDDTIDKGTVTIEDVTAPTKVYFNKHYYTKPEVTVTLQSGNTSSGVITPNIAEIGKDDSGYFFTVELLKDNGNRTTGRITWNSIGY